MNMIEVNLAQRGTLPLPSASLVIDMRGIDGDDVIDRLRVEIADLANEMKLHEVNHWRYLTEFLSFRQLSPLRTEEIDAILAQDQSTGASTPPKVSARNTSHQKRHGSAGNAKDEKKTTLFSFEDDEFAHEEKASDVFQQHIEELILEANRIRNNRIAAVNDLNKEGIPGRNMPDATTRVIFLTEASNSESLTSASAYAAKLKEHFVKLERKRHQHLLSTTIMCLNASGAEGPPTDLIYGLLWNDDWKHIDSILLSEQYREDAALIEGPMQAYLAELLLYVLLIIPPLTLNSPAPSESATPTPPPSLEAPDGSVAPKGKWVHLPDATYLVGIGTIEHSTRWGRRWINYSLVTQAAKLLMDRGSSEDLERKRQRNIADNWLKNWFLKIEQAIPDKIPGNIAALKAFSNAQVVSHPRVEIFTSRRFSFTINETTIKDLQSYLIGLTDTYTPSSPGQARTYRTRPSTSEQVTLQDAVDSIPQIERRIREWEDRDTSLRKNTPLLDAQLDAQYVLSNPDFFMGARGAIPRARMQLRELGNAISENKNTHDHNSLDLSARKEQLEKRGNDLIHDLEDHTHGFPLLAGRFGLGAFFKFLILLLAFCLIGVLAVIGFAWLRQLFPVMDNVLLTSDSFFAYIFWGIILLLDLIIVIALGNNLFKKKRSPLETEFFFLLTLFLVAVSGILLSLSSHAFENAQAINSLTLIDWISPFLYRMSIICMTIAIIITLIEIAWFIWWSDRLLTDRLQVVEELQHIYQQDVADVSFFIAETIGLQLLYYAGLTDGKGGPGSYYNRIDHLYKRFGEIEHEADHQQRLAARRLSMSISELQPGAATNAEETWLNLKIREEKLDVNALADGFKGLKERMSKEDSELGDLAEILLSVMGEVTPIEVERQFREKIAASSEIRSIRAFMTTLVATTLRFSIAPQSISSIDPLIERYDNLDSQYVHRLPGLSILIDTLSKKVREATVKPLLDDEEDSDLQKVGNSPEGIRANSILATNALALWEQTLWENTDSKLPSILARSGVLAKLMEDEDYDARAVMRRLQSHTALFGRTIASDNSGEFRLILSPSAHSRTFRQSLGIPSRLIIDFPDIERLLLLYIQRYESEALFVEQTEPDNASSSH